MRGRSNEAIAAACLYIACRFPSIISFDFHWKMWQTWKKSPSILILESPSSQAGGSAQDFQRDCCSVHREQEGHWSLLQDHPQVARGHQSRARRQRRLHVQVLRPPRAHQGDSKGCHVDCEKGERSGADRGEVSSFSISCVHLHGKPGELWQKKPRWDCCNCRSIIATNCKLLPTECAFLRIYSSQSTLRILFDDISWYNNHFNFNILFDISYHLTSILCGSRKKYSWGVFVHNWAAGVAETTLKQCYKLILPKAGKLFPANFTFVTPVDQLPLN